jgi:hypothetical protein
MLTISTIKRLYFLILVSSIYLGLGPPPLINKSWFFLFEGIHPPRLFHPLARVILSVKCCAGGRPARRRTGEEEDWRYSLLQTSMLRPPLALSHHASRHHWTLAGCLVQSVRLECLWYDTGTSPMAKPRNEQIPPLHEEPSTCSRAFLQLCNADHFAPRKVPPSCARYLPLPMMNVMMIAFALLSLRASHSVSLPQLLLHVHHPTLVVQPSTVLIVLPTALALLALLLTFVVYRSARFFSALHQTQLS